MNTIACLILVSAVVCDVSHAASASLGAGGAAGAIAGAAGKAGAAASGAASGSASGSGAASVSAVTDAAIQLLVKIQQKMCTNPPPGADESAKILKCCPMRKFFVSTVLNSNHLLGHYLLIVFVPLFVVETNQKIAVKDLRHVPLRGDQRGRESGGGHV